MITLGKQIQMLRVARGLKQHELARMVDIRQPTFSEFENDKLRPSEETLRKIKAALRWPDEDQARVAFFILGEDKDGN